MKRLQACFYFLLSFVSLIAILGSLFYIAWGLSLASRIIVLLLSLSLSALLLIFAPLREESKENLSARIPLSRRDLIVTALYLLACAVGFYLLYKGRSDRPLITPWQTVSAWEFLAYGIGSACLLHLRQLRSSFPIALLSLHYLWTFSIFLFVYAIGYGFDPFIHEASIRAIEASGKIQPLTIYYLGQYSLVTVFHLFGGSIAWWSKLLVPILAALTLPWLLRKRGSAVALIIFSFSILTVTTPQNLAYLFLLLALLISLEYKNRSSRLLMWLLALAAFFTQPIAGIPTLLLATWKSIESSNMRVLVQYRKTTYLLLLTGYIFGVPLALYIFSASGDSATALSFPKLATLFADLKPGNPSHESWWLNFIYLWEANRGWVYALLAIISTLIAWRCRDKNLLRRYAWPAAGLVISGVLTMAIDFHFLIEYERSDYPLRLLTLASLFALPLVIGSLEPFFERVRSLPYTQRLIAYLFLSALAASSLYLSYPRFDHYHNSRGYASSKADLLATRWIEKDAQGRDYVVLANQQTSAAALRNAGFKKYYHDTIFYYPIPTGGPLYQKYLSMVKEPSRATAIEAMNLAGVDRAYFVLDEYWWESDRVAAEAAFIADHSESISNDQVRVYSFSR